MRPRHKKSIPSIASISTTTDPRLTPCGRVILQAALRLHGTTISRRRRRWHQSPTAKPISQFLAYFSHTVSAQKMIKLFFSLFGANQRYYKYFDLDT